MRIKQDIRVFDENTFCVFRTLSRFGDMTKRDLAKECGLSWGGVCNCVSRLARTGVIDEGKSAATGARGRIPGYIDITEKDYLCVGIDAALGRVTGVVTTLGGKQLCTQTHRLTEYSGGAVVGAITDMAERMIRYAGGREHIAAIGVALPATTIGAAGMGGFLHPFTSAFPSNFTDLLEKHFGVDVRLFPDPDCLLAAELDALTEDEECENILGIRWSNGIGMSVLIGGRLYHGSYGMAGEIAHLTAVEGGRPCTCGKRGCLETYASVRAVTARVAESLGREVSFDEVLEMYRLGNSTAVSAVDGAVNMMAKALSHTINILAPDLVVVGGEFSHLPQECFENLCRRVASDIIQNNRVRIKPSVLADDAAAHGAAILLTYDVYQKFIDDKLKEKNA